MTSKEALEWLDAVINDPKVHRGNHLDNNIALSIIKKDLEVLEIIKKYFRITADDMVWGKLLSIVSRSDYEESEGIDVTACADIEEISEYEKIKEWLNDNEE